MLQLSVQQEGEADMDMELLRKGMMAMKLKGQDQEERGGGHSPTRQSGGVDIDEEAIGGLMPGEISVPFRHRIPSMVLMRYSGSW